VDVSPAMIELASRRRPIANTTIALPTWSTTVLEAVAFTRRDERWHADCARSPFASDATRWSSIARTATAWIDHFATDRYLSGRNPSS
jgi:hypothetical protein